MTTHILLQLTSTTEHSGEQQRLRNRLLKSGYQASAEKKGMLERGDVPPSELPAALATLRQEKAAHPNVTIRVIYAADLLIEND